jgi:cytochrome c-type biogenesis protein CcmF
MKIPRRILLLFKGTPTDMGKYDVTYARDTINNSERKNILNSPLKEKMITSGFSVYPDVMQNNKGQEGFSANPDKKHYWDRDIFVYVSSFQQGKTDDTSQFRPVEMKAGDTAFYSNGMIVVE